MKHELLEFIDKRLNSLIDRPGIWGGDFPAETQILLLLEMRDLVNGVPGSVMDSFSSFIEEAINGTAEPLAIQLELLGRSAEFGPLMRTFVNKYSGEKTPAKAASDLIDKLGDKASWEDIKYAISVRSSIEAGLADSKAGRVVSNKEVRRRYGIKD